MLAEGQEQMPELVRFLDMYSLRVIDTAIVVPVRIVLSIRAERVGDIFLAGRRRVIT